MPRQAVWVELDAQLASGRWNGEPVRCAWVYGGRALEPAKPDGDLDLMVVVDGRDRPMREALTLPEGTLLTTNVIGLDSLGPHHVERNGGFYFTTKLLGPRTLVVDCRGDAERLLARGFAHMLAWARLLDPSLAPSHDADALLAQLVRLVIRLTPCYACHFGRWRANAAFPQLWAASARLVAIADDLLARGEVGAPEPPFAVATAEARELALDYLSTAWWRTNLGLRENDPGYLDHFFGRHVEMARTLGPGALDDAQVFLARVAGNA